MSFTRDLFTGLGFNWSATHYETPAGQLPGNQDFSAGVLFNPSYGGPPGTFGSAVALWGNLDAAAFKGWSIGITAAGLISASHGDGALVTTITFDPGARLARRWCLAQLGFANGGLALWINGSLAVASAPGLNPLVPSGKACALGDAWDSSAPFDGIIAGAFYSTPAVSVDPFQRGADVARHGQPAVPYDATNSWQETFFNAKSGAADSIWLPSTGTVDLTRVGEANTLTVMNASSNAWL